MKHLSLRDILSLKSPDNENRPFREMTSVLGGFRQISPIIPKGRMIDIVETLIILSYLWCYFEVLNLKINKYPRAFNIIHE